MSTGTSGHRHCALSICYFVGEYLHCLSTSFDCPKQPPNGSVLRLGLSSRHASIFAHSCVNSRSQSVGGGCLSSSRPSGGPLGRRSLSALLGSSARVSPSYRAFAAQRGRSWAPTAGSPPRRLYGLVQDAGHCPKYRFRWTLKGVKVEAQGQSVTFVRKYGS